MPNLNKDKDFMSLNVKMAVIKLDNFDPLKRLLGKTLLFSFLKISMSETGRGCKTVMFTFHISVGMIQTVAMHNY